MKSLNISKLYVQLHIVQLLAEFRYLSEASLQKPLLFFLLFIQRPFNLLVLDSFEL
jgi:hypothetical protein